MSGPSQWRDKLLRLGPARALARVVSPFRRRGFSSHEYWDIRYSQGGTSGAGSYGQSAEYKSQYLNAFVREYSVESVVEFGCGDGNQLRLARYPKYTGYDVSETAIKRCRELFEGDQTKTFFLLRDYDGRRADLALSLDVIYHLVEESVFEEHMKVLFASANRHVIIFSTNRSMNGVAPHVFHREFSTWVERHQQAWQLIAVERSPELPRSQRGEPQADFYVYELKP